MVPGTSPEGRAGEFVTPTGSIGAEGATAPGISQATGPRAPDSLESAPAESPEPPKG